MGAPAAGAKTALDEAVREAREREAAAPPAQLGLFGEERSPGGAGVPAVTERRIGRPVGARNKRTDEISRLYMAEFGDPLRKAVEIAALPILAPGVLDEVTKLLGAPSRFEAFKQWKDMLISVLPYLHQRLATLTVRPEGAPDGPAAMWGMMGDEDGDVFDMLTGSRVVEPEEEAIDP